MAPLQQPQNLSLRLGLLVILLFPTYASPHQQIAPKLPLTRAQFTHLIETGEYPPPITTPDPTINPRPHLAQGLPGVVLIPDLDLQNLHTTANPIPPPNSLQPFTAVDYIRACCATSPISRVGHCVPLRTAGPLQRLAETLHSAYGYSDGDNLVAVSYDPATAPHALGQPTGPFAHAFYRAVALASNSAAPGRLGKLRRPVLLAAHGYGCIVAAQVLGRADAAWRANAIERLWCIAPPLGGSVAAGMRLISGHAMGVGESVSHFSMPASWETARSRKRIDIRAMEFSLGLHVRKRGGTLLPVVPGVWDTLASGHVTLEVEDWQNSQWKMAGGLASMLPNALAKGKANGREEAVFPIALNGADFDEFPNGTLNVMKNVFPSLEAQAFVEDSLSWSRSSMAQVLPHLPLTCVFGTGIDTPAKIRYSSTGTTPEITDWKDGDGEVEYDYAAQVCEDWATRQNEEVLSQEVPGAHHSDMIALTAGLRLFLDSKVRDRT